jgi:hypothetical protein
MNIELSNGYITLVSCQSKSELQENIRIYSNDSIMLGFDTDYMRDFYLVKVCLTTKNKVFGIGIASEGHGLKPKLLLLPENNILLLGYNKSVSLVNCINNQLVKSICLDSLFYDFYKSEVHQKIIVIHETGVKVISFEGDALWDYNGDIVKDYEIKDDILKLVFMDGEISWFDLFSGIRVK